MIAARLAGGNLFFGFLGGGLLGGDFWSTRSSSEHSDFLRGIWWWGFLEHSEQLGALGFFLRGFLGGGFFFWGVVGVFWIVSVGKN